MNACSLGGPQPLGRRSSMQLTPSSSLGSCPERTAASAAAFAAAPSASSPSAAAAGACVKKQQGQHADDYAQCCPYMVCKAGVDWCALMGSPLPAKDRFSLLCCLHASLSLLLMLLPAATTCSCSLLRLMKHHKHQLLLTGSFSAALLRHAAAAVFATYAAFSVSRNKSCTVLQEDSLARRCSSSVLQ
jgi:hypothetical protein